MKSVRQNLVDKVAELYDAGERTGIIAQKLGISNTTVRDYIKRSGRKSRPIGKPLIFSTEYEALVAIDEYQNGASLSELADKYNCSITGLTDALKKYGLESRGQFDKNGIAYNRKYSCNDNYFNKIDSGDKAYWLGFLYADGCNMEDRNSVYLNQSAPRDYILHKFKKSIKATNPINLTKAACVREIKDRMVNVQDAFRIQIISQQLSQDLAKLGCGQNKTHTLTFPTTDQVPKEFYADFIRGYFDGDGSVSAHSGGKELQFNFMGTKEFLTGLQKIFIRLGFSETKISPARKDAEIHMLIYAGIKNIKRFYNYIYNGSPLYLIDKKEKFEKYIASKKIAKEQKLQDKIEINNKIKDLHSKGMSFREISKTLNVSRTAMTEIVSV
jgi:predicted DNA-binding protein YlxM (UPF0122 family)